MIKPIIHDQNLLAQPSSTATSADELAIRNLKDTLIANSRQAAGIAANMINVHKRIIAFNLGNVPVIMINPEIIAKSHAYNVKEGCLSLTGERSVQRYQKITVKFQDEQFNWNTQTFQDWIAEVIQHEIDHCNGILI